MSDLKTCPLCAEVIKAAAIKCRYCGASLVAAEHGASSPMQAVETIRPTRTEPAAPAKKRNWWVVLAVLGTGFGLSGYAASASGAAAIFLIVVGIVFLGLLVADRIVPTSPAVRSISDQMRRNKWSAIAIIAITIGGGASGLQRRADRYKECTSKIAAAEAQRQASTASAASFTEAASACEKADRPDDQKRAEDAARGVASEIAAKQKAKNEAIYAAALSEAKQFAAKPGSEGQAVASYRRAASVGSLDAESSRQYALQLREHGRQLVAAKNYADAVAEFEEAKRRAADLADVDGLLADARKSQQAIAAATSVDTAISAAKNRCGSFDDLAAAWNGIRGIAKGDQQYPRAVNAAANLDRCRRSVYQERLQELRQAMKALREKMSSEYDRKLLSEGLDVRVALGGALKDRLTIGYVLFNRAWAFKITDGGSMKEGSFLKTLETAGFKRVTFSDGYDASYSYDLAPMSEEKALAGKGLDEAFRF